MPQSAIILGRSMLSMLRNRHISTTKRQADKNRHITISPQTCSYLNHSISKIQTRVNKEEANEKSTFRDIENMKREQARVNQRLGWERCQVFVARQVNMRMNGVRTEGTEKDSKDIFEKYKHRIRDTQNRIALQWERQGVRGSGWYSMLIWLGILLKVSTAHFLPSPRTICLLISSTLPLTASRYCSTPTPSSSLIPPPLYSTNCTSSPHPTFSPHPPIPTTLPTSPPLTVTSDAFFSGCSKQCAHINPFSMLLQIVYGVMYWEEGGDAHRKYPSRKEQQRITRLCRNIQFVTIQTQTQMINLIIRPMSCRIDQPLQLDSADNSGLMFALTSTMFMVNSEEEAMHQVDLIHQQNQVLKDIRDRLDNKKTSCFLTQSDQSQPILQKCNSSVFRPHQISRKGADFPPPLQRSRRSGNSSFQTLKFRRRAIPTAEDIDDLMREVHIKCNSEANQTLNYVVKNMRELAKKVTDSENITELIERDKKNFVVLKNDYAQLEMKLLEAEQKLKYNEENFVPKEILEREKKNHSQNMVEKEKQLNKIQTSLLIKQKLLNEDIKKVNSRMSFIIKQDKDLKQQRKTMDNLWQQLITRIDGGRQSTFQSHIYLKCKESLLKQRKALTDQQQQLDKHHSIIERLITQLQGVEAA